MHTYNNFDNKYTKTKINKRLYELKVDLTY